MPWVQWKIGIRDSTIGAGLGSVRVNDAWGSDERTCPIYRPHS